MEWDRRSVIKRIRVLKCLRWQKWKFIFFSPCAKKLNTTKKKRERERERDDIKICCIRFLWAGANKFKFSFLRRPFNISERCLTYRYHQNFKLGYVREAVRVRLLLIQSWGKHSNIGGERCILKRKIENLQSQLVTDLAWLARYEYSLWTSSPHSRHLNSTRVLICNISVSCTVYP